MQNKTFSGLFVGQNIVSLKRVDSTNDYLKKQVANSKPLPEGTVILAEDQFAGRGQFNNNWVSQPGKNLTFSILLSPTFLPLSQQFSLNIAISLAINDALCSFIGSECKIKWPNDIFFHDQKLGGVLIENIVRGANWKYSIVGIGLNVNQTSFPGSIKNITSTALITKRELVLNDVLTHLCTAIEKRFGQLKNGELVLQREEYTTKLYRLNTLAAFEREGVRFDAEITGVTEAGLLELKTKDGLRCFGLKELKYI
ncbi:biotin--[acetyl-CoA-carboxylase] ligase [Arcticibacter sp.]|uniref:biotin--[acetyl-CoA-carboxylase] ligase n=1 Tax=Arcticibacter sp. TaxID=1872630 RepID=UPI00388DDA19